MILTLWARVLATLFVAVMALQAPAALAAGEKTRVGVLRFVSDAPVFIAYEKGYFAAQGLDVELTFFQAAQPIAVAVSSGDLDFGVTAFSAGMFNLAGKGALKVIGSQFSEKKGYPGSVILAGNKAYAAGLTAVPRIAGKTIAITQMGSSFHYMLGRLGEKVGFPLAGLKLRPLQTLPNMIAALKGNEVDAEILPPHIAKPMIAAGDAKFLGNVSDYFDYQGGAVFMQAKLADRRDFVAKFARAYQKGAADYFDAFLRKDAAGKIVHDEQTAAIGKIIAKYVYKGEDALDKVEAGAFYVDRQGRLDVADVKAQVAWYQKLGAVDAGVDPGKFIDTSFIPPLPPAP